MGNIKIFSYLVKPGKGIEPLPQISSTEIKDSENLSHMLMEVYKKSDEECTIEICFNKSEDGSQSNEAHTLIVNLSKDPSLENGKLIAERLCCFTTGRSGIGLLFLILEKDNDNIKLLISRFPADRGILASQETGGLNLEYLEQIFMKNPNYYKAAYYRGVPIEKSLWSGFAIDKQLGFYDNGIAQYWVHDFLKSGLMTNSKQGSKRFASALILASRKTKDISIKREIVSVITLMSGKNNQAISIDGLISTFSLSSEARKIIIECLPYQELASETFVFDAVEFNSTASYTTIELDNEATLTAPSPSFDSVFSQELVQGEEDVYEFSTKGKITNEKLKGRR